MLRFHFLKKVNQKIAVGVLKKLGYENVDIAENGLKVIDKLDKGSVYDVILVRLNIISMYCFPLCHGQNIEQLTFIVDGRFYAGHGWH